MQFNSPNASYFLLSLFYLSHSSHTLFFSQCTHMNTHSLLSYHLSSGITVLFVGNNFISVPTQRAIITFLSICHCQVLSSFVVKVCVRAVQGHDLACRFVQNDTCKLASVIRRKKDVCFPSETLV